MRIARDFPLEFFQEVVRLEPKLVEATVDDNFNVNIEYKSVDEARAALEERGIVLNARHV
jgi:hypothetical protein